MGPIERICGAVKDPGRVPSHHMRQIRRLREEWPTLYEVVAGERMKL